MFTAWGGRKVSEYWGNVFRCGKSGFTVNRGAVNRGFTVLRSYCLTFILDSSMLQIYYNLLNNMFYYMPCWLLFLIL